MGQCNSKVVSKSLDENKIDVPVELIMARATKYPDFFQSGIMEKILNSKGASKTYFICRDLPEAKVNIYLCLTKPTPNPSTKLNVTLPPHLEQWLASQVVAAAAAAASSSSATDRHFLLDDAQIPAFSNKRIAKVASDVTKWQKALQGSLDSKFWDVWPSDFSPEDMLELKLAIERGDDKSTLIDLVRNDLDRDNIKEELFRRLELAAKELLKQRGATYAITLVSTDVDDTWVASIFDRNRYERGTIYPGYRELLAAQGDFLTVLTARPAIMAGGTRKHALERLKLPSDKPENTNVNVSPGHLSEAVDSVAMGMLKMDTILLQSRWAEYFTTEIYGIYTYFIIILYMHIVFNNFILYCAFTADFILKLG